MADDKEDHKVKTELLLIILVSVTASALFCALLISQINVAPISEFLTQSVPGGLFTVLLLGATAAGLYLSRRVSNIADLYRKALRDKEHGEEQLRVMSAKVQKRMDGNAADAEQIDTFCPQQKAGLTVLLVDDHVMVRQGLRSIMEGFPHIEIIGEASNGNEAVKLVRKRRPAVVLMDINMPQLNGIEATAKIKSEYPDTAVIGLAVNAEKANQEAMKKAGASMLLPKETVVNELYNAILSVCAQPATKPHAHGLL